MTSSPNNTSTDRAEFWQWFESCESLLRRDADEAMQSELGRRVRAFGLFAWELGPGFVKESSLVVSPDGNPDLLAETKALVECAPELEHWEFYGARQAKARLNVRRQGRLLAFDAHAWSYVLYAYDDGMFDLVIEAPDLVATSGLVTPDHIARVVVDNLIGEERTLELFSGIEVVQTIEESLRVKASSMATFAEHIQTLST